MNELEFPLNHERLGQLAAQLRSEGFEAQGDLYNGWPGLLIGPKGLDSERVPSGLKALFFPLWELNTPANRSLVAARRFHDLYDNRPADWKYDRPYSD